MDRSTRIRRRASALAVGGLAAIVALWLLGAAIGGLAPDPAPGAPPGEAELSLLALGDTGKRHRWLARWFEGQLAVAAGLAAEDSRLPIDYLLFLGDNFYMDGLRQSELVARVRENLVLPYCRFVAPSGPRAAEIASACRVDERHPVPILAVLGNHDRKSPESVRLERAAVPQFIPNWRLLPGFVETLELGHGVSLTLLDTSGDLESADADALADALRRGEGPWRIVATHVPSLVDDEGGLRPLLPLVRDAIARAGVRVHVYLSGHHHSLQLLEGEPPGPVLHVIAGSGSRSRPIRRDHPGRRYGAARHGFARIDLVGAGLAQRLVVSLFATASVPILAGERPSLVASWSVDHSGSARDELATQSATRPGD